MLAGGESFGSAIRWYSMKSLLTTFRQRKRCRVNAREQVFTWEWLQDCKDIQQVFSPNWLEDEAVPSRWIGTRSPANSKSAGIRTAWRLPLPKSSASVACVWLRMRGLASARPFHMQGHVCDDARRNSSRADNSGEPDN